MTTYTLTQGEAFEYDFGDDERTDRLAANLRKRFGRISAGEAVETEVRHPDGFVISAHTSVTL